MLHTNEFTTYKPNRITEALSLDQAQFRDWLLAPTVHQPRITASEDGIRCSLANEDGDTVEMTATGWKITSDAAHGTCPNSATADLPRPSGADFVPVNFDALRNLLDLRDRDDWNRCLCWLLAALRPEGPYPTLVIKGPPSSGKTTAALLLRSLIDPVHSPLNSQVSEHHWIILADGRPLPVTDKPAILVVSNPSTPLPAGPTFTIHTRRVPSAKTRRQFAIWEDYKLLRPQTLAGLFAAVCSALANRKQVDGYSDWNDWLLAAGPAIGLTPLDVEAVCQRRKPEPSPDILAETFAGLLGSSTSWKGPPSQLLKELHAIHPDSTDWPRTGYEISRRLGRAAAALRPQGITFTFPGKGRVELARTKPISNQAPLRASQR